MIISCKAIGRRLAWAFLGCCGMGWGVLVAQDDFFSREVVPIFNSHCTECHGGEKVKGKLRLDDVAGILRGGGSGEPFLIAGKPEESLLLRRVTSQDEGEWMPPKGDRLSDAEIAVLRRWIDEGARMPGGEEPVQVETDHWAFQPVKRPSIPKVSRAEIRNPIDSFIFQKLSENGLQWSEEAPRKGLIRRLFLVALGLPPSPEAVKRFEQDKRPDAVELLVEEVLQSPRFGERWARHWLDVVRYADSNGFETNRERKNAYPYRDYVIRSFNEDKPYVDFVREQVAGDVYGEPVGTGFLVAGPFDIVKSPDINLTLMQRQDELADMVNTTGTTFLGLTLGCARCHNHKFDPILQKDYYSMQAVFAGVQHGDRAIPRNLSEEEIREVEGMKQDLEEVKRDIAGYEAMAARAKDLKRSQEEGQLREGVNALKNEEVFNQVRADRVRFTILATNSGEPCLDEWEVYNVDGENIALASAGGVPRASGSLQGYEIHQLKHINDGKTGNSHSWISNEPGSGWVEIQFAAEEDIVRMVWGRDRAGQFGDRVAVKYRIEARRGEGEWMVLASSDDRMPPGGEPQPLDYLRFLEKADEVMARAAEEKKARLQKAIVDREGRELVWVGQFREPEPTHRLYRGDPMQKREVVVPDGLTVLGSLGMGEGTPESERRRRLADWIASSDHPLTARVMVNRLWHYVFGVGIVDTPSDFGANGGIPTHPELLDWMASEFVARGWSVKEMLRLIFTSHTFRQASWEQEEGLARDAQGRLLWRFPPRRLEAEILRDCILAASGALDLRMGGEGFYLLDVQVENVMHYFPKEQFGPPEFRRMVYMSKIRQEQDAIFGSFDCPDGNQVIPRRSRSNTPIQALNLFNSPFLLQQAELFVERLAREAGEDEGSRIDWAFWILLSRAPDAVERQAALELVRDHGWEALGRAMLNLSEFLFVF